MAEQQGRHASRRTKKISSFLNDRPVQPVNNDTITAPSGEYMKNSYDSYSNVDLDIELSYSPQDGFIIKSLRTVRIPWLNERMKKSGQRILTGMMKEFTHGSKCDCGRLLHEFSTRLSDEFNQNIGCNIYFRCIPTIHATKSDAKDYLTNCPDGSLLFEDEDIGENSLNITFDDIEKLEIPLLEISKATTISLKLKKSAYLTKIELLYANDIICEEDIQIETIIAHREYSFELPKIARERLETINEKNIGIRLTLNEKNSIVVSRKAQLADDTKSSIAPHITLFMDMGSTFTKYIMLQKESSINQWTDRDILRKEGPAKTEEFCKRIGVGKYDKRTLAGKGIEYFADEHEKLSNGIIEEIYKRYGKIVDKIYWSFPRLKSVLPDGFFDKVSKKTSDLLRNNVPEGITFIPEDYALRKMFETTVKKLSLLGVEEQNRIAQINKERRDEALRKYEREMNEYNRGWFSFITKMFRSRPTLLECKDETLGEYYEKCLSIGCNEGLKNFILLDAGGFTFDVYAELDGEQVIAESLTAGGVSLTEKYHEYLVEGNPKTTMEEAEQEKRDLCSSPDYKEYADYEVFKKLTEETYDNAISGIIEKIQNKELSGQKRLVVICSGAALRNPCLKNLLKERLSQKNIISEDTMQWQDTEAIYDFLCSGNVRVDIPAFQMFLCIAAGSEVKKIDSSLDIAGGMLFNTYSEEDKK